MTVELPVEDDEPLRTLPLEVPLWRLLEPLAAVVCLELPVEGVCRTVVVERLLLVPEALVVCLLLPEPFEDDVDVDRLERSSVDGEL